MDIASIWKARLRSGSFTGAYANECQRCGANFSGFASRHDDSDHCFWALVAVVEPAAAVVGAVPPLGAVAVPVLNTTAFN